MRAEKQELYNSILEILNKIDNFNFMHNNNFYYFYKNNDCIFLKLIDKNNNMILNKDILTYHIVLDYLLSYNINKIIEYKYLNLKLNKEITENNNNKKLKI